MSKKIKKKSDDVNNENNESNYSIQSKESVKSNQNINQITKSEEDKIKEQKEAKRRSNKQIIRCKFCDVSFARCNKDHHEKTQKHLHKKLIFECNQTINDLENKVQMIKVIL